MTQPYTKTPNIILEAIPDMSEAELKLTMVLVRLTYGYHTNEVRMTYDDMEKSTGLSRPAVSRAIDLVTARGFFTRERRSMWVANSNKLLLNEVNHSNNSLLNEAENSNNMLPNEDENSNNSLPYYSNNLLPSSIYKEKKKKKVYKENGIYTHELPPDLHPFPDEQERLQDMIAAIAGVVKETYVPGFDSDKFEQAAAAFLQTGITVEQVADFSKWWAKPGNGYYKGKPAIKSLIQEIQNSIAPAQEVVTTLEPIVWREEWGNE